jgi:hypothetical protein
MTRYTFGGTAADIVTDTAGNYTTDAGTAWTSRVGGTQVTDLLDTNGNPLVGGTISTLTDPVGLVIFQGPDDGTNVLWVDFGGGRVKMTAWDGKADRGDSGSIEIGDIPDLSSLYAPLTVASKGVVREDELVYNVKDYGATGDGVADDTAEIQAAIAAAIAAGGGVVYLPVGTYKISSALTINGSRVTVQGTGPASKIVQSALAANIFTVGNAVTATYGPTFRDFSVTSSSIQTAGWAFACEYVAQASWERVALQTAADAEAGKKLYGGIQLNKFDNCKITQCEIINAGPAATSIAVLANGKIDGTWGADVVLGGGTKIAGWDSGLTIGGAVGGAYIDQTMFISNYYNVEIDTVTVALTNREVFFGPQAIIDLCTYTGMLIAANSLTHLDCVGTWIASAGQIGDGVNGGVNIGAQTAISVYNFSNCRIYNHVSFGIVLQGQLRLILDGCSMQYNGTVAANATLGSAVSALGNDVDLTMTNCQVHNNGDAGDTRGYGLYMQGTGHRVVVEGNIFRDNVNGALTVPTTATAQIHTNIGYNPRGNLTAPAIPATTVAQTNTFGTDCSVYVAGGTVSAVSIGGTTTGLTTGHFRVPANQTITLTYTVAPTWKWFGD